MANLVVGKFYPPHEGHHYLIEQALAEGDQVIVAIMWSEKEKIRPGLRKRWIRDAHDAYLDFVLIKDELPVDFSDRELSFEHAKLIQDKMGRSMWSCPPITKVIGSEEYVDHLADYFRAEPVCVDPERNTVPISATKIREDPREYWYYLRGPARAGLCKRVVCIGAESCGTTTLAKDLAQHYGTVWVPEYGRMYSEGLTTGVWRHEDLEHIAASQRRMEDSLARRSEHGLLICDTNALATQIWDEFLVGYPSEVMPSSADLYIITDLCPWEDDGTRFLKDVREQMQKRFIERTEGFPRIYVTGGREARIRKAIAAIDKLTWEF